MTRETDSVPGLSLRIVKCIRIVLCEILRYAQNDKFVQTRRGGCHHPPEQIRKFAQTNGEGKPPPYRESNIHCTNLKADSREGSPYTNSKQNGFQPILFSVTYERSYRL